MLWLTQASQWKNCMRRLAIRPIRGKIVDQVPNRRGLLRVSQKIQETWKRISLFQWWKKIYRRAQLGAYYRKEGVLLKLEALRQRILALRVTYMSWRWNLIKIVLSLRAFIKRLSIQRIRAEMGEKVILVLLNRRNRLKRRPLKVQHQCLKINSKMSDIIK